MQNFGKPFMAIVSHAFISLFLALRSYVHMEIAFSDNQLRCLEDEELKDVAYSFELNW
jgi:hypothetical protein